MTIPLRPIDKLTIACARFKRASPNAFEEFEKELNSLCGQRAGEVVTAGPDKVFVAQGKAQQAMELCNLLKDCLAEADKLEAKMKNSRT